MNDAVILLCSRPESSRLPRKVFRKAAGKSLIQHINDRLNKSDIPRVLLLPDNIGIKDHALYCEQWGGTCAFGDAKSPLHRMAEFMKFAGSNIKYVIRVTHDDPIIDVPEMERLLRTVRERGAGYGVTPGLPEGAGVEVIHVDNLRHAAENHKEPTEYVSYHVRGKNMPKPGVVYVQADRTKARDYRLTIDYPEDLQVLDIVLRAVGASANTEQITAFLDRNPHLLSLNRLPDVSIYTCAYNAEKYIRQAVDSVMNCLGFPVSCEYIFIDDASTDNTIVEATKAFRLLPTKIHLNETNIGLASSCNIALKMARGKYIMRLDADDVLLPHAISKLIGVAEKKKAAVVYPAYSTINEYDGVIDKFVYGAENHHAGCALFNRSMLNEVKFTEGLKHWDSLDLYNRIKKKYPIAYYSDPLWHYRRHDSNISNPSAERDAAKERIAK